MNGGESAYSPSGPGRADRAGPQVEDPELHAAGPDPLGLARPALHELAAATHHDMPGLVPLALAALAREHPGAILWVACGGAWREHGAPFAPGLLGMGIDPGRLLLARARKPLDALAAVEEGLLSGAVAAVVGEVTEAGFTATRRLALAAGRHGVPAVLAFPHARAGSTAAGARWRVAARPSAGDPFDPEAPGPPRWRAVMERGRRAPQTAGATLDLELDDATHSLRLVSGLADRPAAPRPTRGAERLAALLRDAG
jgi:protein ImuA